MEARVKYVKALKGGPMTLQLGLDTIVYFYFRAYLVGQISCGSGYIMQILASPHSYLTSIYKCSFQNPESFSFITRSMTKALISQDK